MQEAPLAGSFALYQLPSDYTPTYGTAGFRADAAVLGSTVFRCGVLTAARAIVTGQACGLMITASHNQESDNGVKIVEPSGEMLCPEWEQWATKLAQAISAQEASVIIQQLVEGRDGAATSDGVAVVIGRDTRPSGPALFAAAKAGVTALGVKIVDAGLVTTPQLHFYVMQLNAGLPATEEAYIQQLSTSFATLMQGTQPSTQAVVVDCANGIGARRLSALQQQLASHGALTLQLHNTGEGKLNHQVGADYVQKEQTFPQGLQGCAEGQPCCSIDGDADRLVYFTSHSGSFKLLDGDKIATLLAIFVRDCLAQLPTSFSSQLKIGVVQTAYANGASTQYISQQLGLATPCTATGVKHLHEEAKQYDVGVYFESNGHGTVLFSPALLQQLAQLAAQHAAAADLLALSRLMNQAVGDAISGLLAVQVVLARKAWGLQQWLGLYTDLPSRQTKLKVADRAAIRTTDAERRCETPVGLQQAIDAAVARYDRGRAFARPSGTEDAVRVYAEAASQELADALAREVGQLVYDMAGGVGQRP